MSIFRPRQHTEVRYNHGFPSDTDWFKLRGSSGDYFILVGDGVPTSTHADRVSFGSRYTDRLTGIEYILDSNSEWIEIMNRDYLTEVKRGNVSGVSLIHKFGRNAVVGNSPEPIAINGVYRTPAANQTDLEIVSDDAEDDITGDGARKVTIQGLQFSGGVLVAVEEEISMDGTTPVSLAEDYARIFRMWVSESGDYADPTTPSAQGTITISENVSGDEWIVIDEFAAGNSSGQTQTALYTTPSATTSVLLGLHWSIEGNKIVKLFFFHRPNADDVSLPYSGARRLVFQVDDAINAPYPTLNIPLAHFTGATDMGFMGVTSVGDSTVSADFWLLVIDN